MPRSLSVSRSELAFVHSLREESFVMSSFYFDFNLLMTNAVSIFNSIGGVFLMIGGIGIGIGLAKLVVREVGNAI